MVARAVGSCGRPNSSPSTLRNEPGDKRLTRGGGGILRKSGVGVGGRGWNSGQKEKKTPPRIV